MMPETTTAKITSSYSSEVLAPDSMIAKALDDLIDFEKNPAAKFDQAHLDEVVKKMSALIKDTDLKDFKVMSMKMKSGPLNKFELAEFMNAVQVDIDKLEKVIDDEKMSRIIYTGQSKKMEGVITEFEIVKFDRKTLPSMHDRITVEGGASFDVITGENSVPIVRIVNGGSGYKVGQLLTIKELNVTIRVKKVDSIELALKGGTHSSSSVQGTLATVEVEKYTEGHKPGLYKGVKALGTGGATFDVTIREGQEPLVEIVDPGKGYHHDDFVELEKFGIVLDVRRTISASLHYMSKVSSTVKRTQNESSTVAYKVVEPKPVTKIGDEPFVEERKKETSNEEEPVVEDSTESETTIGDEPYVEERTKETTIGDEPYVEERAVEEPEYTAAGKKNPKSKSSKSSGFADILQQLDFFLNKDFAGSIMGGGSFGSTAILDDIMSALKFDIQLPSLIEDLWSGKEINFSLPSVLSSLEGQLHKVIDGVKNQMMSTLNNMKGRIASIAGGAGSVFNALNRKLQDANNFFAESNLNKVRGLVGYVMENMKNQFLSPTNEILQWITSRTSKISGFLEQIMVQPVNVLNESIRRYESAFNLLQNESSYNTGNAVSAGALRVPYVQTQRDSTAAAENANAVNNGSSQTDTAIGPSRYATTPITDTERSKLNSEMTGQGWPGYLTFSGGVTGEGRPLLEQDRNGNPMEGAGWRMVLREHPEVWIMIARVSQRLGTVLTVNSAYRSPAYNRTLNGAATNSMHISAKALDISMAGINRETFIKYASQEGFLGIGTYNSFIHVDVGRRRIWGSRDSSALAIHKADNFRKGQSGGGSSTPLTS